MMTRPNTLIIALVLLAATLIPACGDDPAAPQETKNQPPPLEVTSGTFDVTSHVAFNTCNTAGDYDGTYDIDIDGSDFTMGTAWAGSWDAKTVTGLGESEHTSETLRLCTVRRWTEVSITFSSEDEFSGRIIFRQRVNGECREPCQTTWLIEGVRQQPAP